MRKVTFTVFCLLILTGSGWAEQTTQSAPSKPASPAISKMTNTDVIQMVTAGLSEQVIITSIRGASAKDFDLTPAGLLALKKAGVSDALILVMQDAGAPAVAVPSARPIKAATGSSADFESEIEAGREISLPIKYASGALDLRRTTALYTPDGGPAVYMADGVLTLSKTTFAFRGTVGAYDFKVSLDKILELANQPEQSHRLHVQVAIKNKKGNKEDKKNYYFYNAGVTAVGDGTVGGPGTSIICSGCDDSMDIAYALLTWVRSRN